MANKSNKRGKTKKNTSNSTKRKRKSTTVNKKEYNKTYIETSKIVEEKIELPEESKNCPNCGVKIIGKFCFNCGTNLTESVLINSEIRKETEVLEDLTTDIDAQVVNPLMVPPVIPMPLEPINLTNENQEPLDSVGSTTPPVNPMGVPGIMPIPNAGIAHNVMRYQPKPNSYSIPKKRDNKLIIIIVLIVLIILLSIFLLIKEQQNQKSLKEKRLNCTLREENFQGGINSQSTFIYIFKNNVLIKTINEETLEFSKESLNYYSYYENALEEMIKEESDIFDNVTLEMKKSADTLTSIYTVDLTADSSNPKNNMEELGYTYQQAKKELELEGYTCK